MSESFTRAELKILAGLRTPTRIQQFLDDDVAYNLEPNGATCYSPRRVLKTKAAHCMEGALLAALALRRLGHPALIVDLEAVRDSDHVLAVYRANGRWGSVAKSDFVGLRSRQPVYRTIRELVMSYFEHYYNARGEKTLRAFSRPVNLARFDRATNWMHSLEDQWEIPTHLCEIPHAPVLPPACKVAKMDRRLYWAGRVGGACEPFFDQRAFDKKAVSGQTSRAVY